MKTIKFLAIAITSMFILSSCSWVQPNYAGVLMTDYGKNGKADFELVKGKVSTVAPGTELFQVPLWEQRADFEDRTLHLQASDQTAFSSRPLYAYKVIENKAIDVVFDNKHLDGGTEFLKSVEDNILEARIYDLMKEESRKYSTDTLMSKGGSLKFEQRLQDIVRTEFEKRGFELTAFSSQLEFSEKVTNKIDQRNEVNQDLAVVEQQIQVQDRKIELARKKALEQLELSKGITQQILQQQFIEKWDGKTPLYGNTPITLMKTVNN